MQVIIPPVGAPVSVVDLAAQLHFDDAEAPMIEALIAAATDVVETATNRPLVSRVVDIELPPGRWDTFWLPCAPAAELVDAAGGTLLTGFDEPRFLREDFEGERIRVRVGYGAPADTPSRLRQAIILLVKEWRDASITIEQVYSAPQMSFGVRVLLRQSRYKRPRVVSDGCP